MVCSFIATVLDPYSAAEARLGEGSCRADCWFNLGKPLCVCLVFTFIEVPLRRLDLCLS
jgi:hypothetical protein